MQTIIGAVGGMGIPLARELKKYTVQIRLVSRNPKQVNEGDMLFPADMKDLSQGDKDIAGSQVVYVVIGFEYKLGAWQKTWPAFMEELEKGPLTALIARAADFYGPDKKNSMLSIMVMDNLLKGKKAQAFGDLSKIHAYTYTPDAGKATALGGNTPDAYQQIWLQLLGLCMPTMKEFPEMMYQFDQDYIFDSTKFEQKFGMVATSPRDGINSLFIQ